MASSKRFGISLALSPYMQQLLRHIFQYSLGFPTVHNQWCKVDTIPNAQILSGSGDMSPRMITEFD